MRVQYLCLSFIIRMTLKRQHGKSTKSIFENRYRCYLLHTEAILYLYMHLSMFIIIAITIVNGIIVIIVVIVIIFYLSHYK